MTDDALDLAALRRGIALERLLRAAEEGMTGAAASNVLDVVRAIVDGTDPLQAINRALDEWAGEDDKSRLWVETHERAARFRSIARSVPCAYCRADPGEPCRSSSGNRTDFHAERRAAAERHASLGDG